MAPGEAGGGACLGEGRWRGGYGWRDVVEKRYHTQPNTPKRCGLMTTAPSQDWNVFKQIFVEHWDGFTRVYPRYNTPYYDGLVDQMLGCENPEKIGYIAYRCLHCGQGTHRVAMRCQASLCLRCAKVYVDNWPRRANTA